MHRKAALLLPVALAISVAAIAEPVPPGAGLAADLPAIDGTAGSSGGGLRKHNLDAIYETPEARQVRIEQRIVVRIVPQSPVPRQSLMAELPQRPAPQQYVERKMEDCVAVGNIAGVQTADGNKLVLYMRDRRVVSARLERSCTARDYYSGFYVERNEDGRICVNRDKLQSRTGAKCEVDRLRRLVPLDDD